MVDRRNDIDPEQAIREAQEFLRSGQSDAALRCLDETDLKAASAELLVRAHLTRGSALYDLDHVDAAIDVLRVACQQARDAPVDAQFAAAFALFTRQCEFQSPEEALPALSELRQLASSSGSPEALAALHLVVARREGLRGNCISARHHVDLARRLSQKGVPIATLCSLDTVESSVELLSGNLGRAKAVAETGLERANDARFLRYVAGCATNLSLVATWVGEMEAARHHIQTVMAVVPKSSRMRFCALDNQLQIAIFEEDLAAGRELLAECARLRSTFRSTRSTWYELSHEWTRCQFAELIGDWQSIIDGVDRIDAELAHRQLRALQTVLLSAKARALAHLGRADLAERALVLADRSQTRGAVDPLIVLEASKGVCLSLKGESGRGAIHLDCALAAARAIGHRYHEQWIKRQRLKDNSTGRRVDEPSLRSDVVATNILLADVSIILDSGHSIALLAQRLSAMLETALGSEAVSVSEIPTDGSMDPRVTWEPMATGAIKLTARSADRAFAIDIRGPRSLEEFGIIRNTIDLARAAIRQSNGCDSEEDDQNLWPRGAVLPQDEAIFQAKRMTELVKVAMRLATSDLPILICGETGTGKEVFARLIHSHSKQRKGQFIASNCSALPRDLVESQLFGHRRGAFTGATDAFPGIIKAAENGTLFLDEIGDLDPGVQPKLLRFLELAEIHPIGEVRPQRVAVRVIAATNTSLDELVSKGGFRSDLYYRLGVATLVLPPLRERKDEIPALAALFLERYSLECRRTGLRLGDDLIAALLLHDWPGNVRELSNEIRRIVAMADDGEKLGIERLGPRISAGWSARPVSTAVEQSASKITIGLDQTLGEAMDELERELVRRAMKASGGRVTEAARILGISRKGLFLKRQRLGFRSGNRGGGRG
jgi:transcriptional regulator with GAF, ATPase, and Fis domain